MKFRSDELLALKANFDNKICLNKKQKIKKKERKNFL